MIPSPWTYATMHKAYRPLLIYQWQAQGLIYLQRIPKKTTTIVSLEKYLLIRVNN